MFDARLQPVLRRVFDPVAARLAARGATADAVTIAGFCIGVVGALALAAGAYRVALALILLNRLADGIDGALARRRRADRSRRLSRHRARFRFLRARALRFRARRPLAQRARGGGAARRLHRHGQQLPRLRRDRRRAGAQGAGISGQGALLSRRPDRGRRDDRASSPRCALWPHAFAALAYAFAALCLVTTLMRWRWGWQAFAPQTDAVSQSQGVPDEKMDSRR